MNKKQDKIHDHRLKERKKQKAEGVTIVMMPLLIRFDIQFFKKMNIKDVCNK